jgi:signal transduction histidine kinase
MTQSVQSSHRNLSQNMLNLSNKRITRIDFFYEIAKLLLDNFSADTVEMVLYEENKTFHTSLVGNTRDHFRYDIFKQDKLSKEELLETNKIRRSYNILKEAVNNIDEAGITGKITRYGTIVAELTNPVFSVLKWGITTDEFYSSHKLASVLMMPINSNGNDTGLICLISETLGKFTKDAIKNLEDLSSIIELAFLYHRNQAALIERRKELTCLYKLAQLSTDSDKPMEDFLVDIAELLPPAWQYPEICSAKIIFDGLLYYTSNYRDGWYKQSADIIVKGINRGFVEVVYSESKPKIDEGPFLAEERSLINFLASQLSYIIERREAEREHRKLYEQLRHTDRLAIIGQLAAGVAHELNEPLSSILGFAQLVGKTPGLNEDASRDLSKIIKASLYAREVIKKLLVFAREASTHMEEINLNNVILDGLYFFEARCIKSQIEIVKSLADRLPRIRGDDSQLNQVLINLVVNSIHAMPSGGKLFIQTAFDDNYVILIVEDTGIGMPDEIRSKIFLPFFTTKDVNEGTGLGLAVVHGIVTAHSGEIKVESWQGRGTRFDIRFPAITSNGDK